MQCSLGVNVSRQAAAIQCGSAGKGIHAQAPHVAAHVQQQAAVHPAGVALQAEGVARWWAGGRAHRAGSAERCPIASSAASAAVARLTAPWPPHLTASGRPWVRAHLTAATTSAVPAGRQNSGGATGYTIVTATVREQQYLADSESSASPSLPPSSSHILTTRLNDECGRGNGVRQVRAPSPDRHCGVKGRVPGHENIPS
jgi:hypothetical protein